MALDERLVEVTCMGDFHQLGESASDPDSQPQQKIWFPQHMGSLAAGLHPNTHAELLAGLICEQT